MKTPQIKKRNWGIDALRIIAMLMIVTWHILWHGGILESAQVSSAQYYIAWYIAMLTFGAVNCYGLISGYVGVQSKFKVSNFILFDYNHGNNGAQGSRDYWMERMVRSIFPDF